MPRRLHSLAGSRFLPWLLGGQTSGVQEPAAEEDGSCWRELYVHRLRPAGQTQPLKRTLTDVEEAGRPRRSCHEADWRRAQHLHDASQLVALILACRAGQGGSFGGRLC